MIESSDWLTIMLSAFSPGMTKPSWQTKCANDPFVVTLSRSRMTPRWTELSGNPQMTVEASLMRHVPAFRLHFCGLGQSSSFRQGHSQRPRSTLHHNLPGQSWRRFINFIKQNFFEREQDNFQNDVGQCIFL